MAGSFFLIPTFIGKQDAQLISKHNLELIYTLKHFIVEREKTARAFLKSIEHPTPQNEFVIHELDKHENYEGYKVYFNRHIVDYSIGLISEAGLPAVADPGSSIVAYAHEQKVTVRPLAGSSSIYLALMGSGMNGQQFCFHGYLPINGNERLTALKRLEKESKHSTQIFMETPYRNNQFLEFLIANLQSHTKLCVAANLESEHELIISKAVKDWKASDVELHKLPCIFLIN